MFKKHRQKPVAPSAPPLTSNNNEMEYNNKAHKQQNGVSPVSPVSKNTLQFHCQLAHGSPMAFVSGFSNVKELYTKIAECFDMEPSEVIFSRVFFCTKNCTLSQKDLISIINCSQWIIKQY